MMAGAGGAMRATGWRATAIRFQQFGEGGLAAACVRSGISERRAANTWSPWSPMLADGEARRCFLFGTWRSAVAELFGNSRSQQLAAGQPSDVLARCWILASAEIPKERLSVSNWIVQKLLSDCEGKVHGLPTAR